MTVLKCVLVLVFFFVTFIGTKDFLEIIENKFGEDCSLICSAILVVVCIVYLLVNAGVIRIC